MDYNPTETDNHINLFYFMIGGNYIMMPAKHVSEDTRLNIDLQTDEIINANIKFLGLKEVTSPIPFERGAVPTIDGLFSEVIFGVTQE